MAKRIIKSIVKSGRWLTVGNAYFKNEFKENSSVKTPIIVTYIAFISDFGRFQYKIYFNDDSELILFDPDEVYREMVEEEK